MRPRSASQSVTVPSNAGRRGEGADLLEPEEPGDAGDREAWVGQIVPRQVPAHFLPDSEERQVFRGQPPSQRPLAHAKRPGDRVGTHPAVGQERSDGILHAGPEWAGRVCPPREGLLAVPDQKPVQIGLCPGETEAGGGVRKDDLVPVGCVGHSTAKGDVDLVRGGTTGMKEADTERPDGGTRQLLGQPAEQGDPELHLVAVGVTWHAGVRAADSEILAGRGLEPDAFVGDGAVPGGAGQGVAQYRGGGEHKVKQARLPRFEALSEVKPEQGIGQGFRHQVQEHDLVSGVHPGLRVPDLGCRHASLAQEGSEIQACRSGPVSRQACNGTCGARGHPLRCRKHVLHGHAPRGAGAKVGKPLAKDSKTGPDRLGYEPALWQQADGRSIPALASGRLFRRYRLSNGERNAAAVPGAGGR